MTPSQARPEDGRENESPTATVITNPSASKLMLDHPGWFVSDDGFAQRAFRSGGTIWMLTCRRVDTSSRAVIEMVRPGNAGAHPAADRFDATSIPTTVRQALLPAGYDTVHRFRNPDLWDALLIPILQHRRKKAEAASMYRSYCALYGEKVTSELGTTLLPPTPEKAITLADNKAVMGLRMPAVRAAAWHYLQLQHDLEVLTK